MVLMIIIIVYQIMIIKDNIDDSDHCDNYSGENSGDAGDYQISDLSKNVIVHKLTIPRQYKWTKCLN